MEEAMLANSSNQSNQILFAQNPSHLNAASGKSSR